MNQKDIEKLVRKGESETLEFKKSTGQLRRAMETSCAFLNADGGMVLIGIRPDKKIIGQDVGEGTIRDITAAFGDFDPPAPITFFRVPLEESAREVIVIKATPSNETRPFTYRGKPYERVGTVTRVMPQERYQRLLLDRTHSVRRWENHPSENKKLGDLDKNAILELIWQGKQNHRIPPDVKDDPVDFLTRFRLMDEDGKVVNAAVTLFGKEDLRYYPQCLLKMARFRGNDRTEFIDNKQVRGHIFDLLKEAQDFIAHHTSIAGRILPGQLQREDKPQYPVYAVREALINAFCHRDYSFHGGSVDLAIYDNVLEVWSHGNLPFDVKIEDLKKPHQSKPRNPIIAEVLFRGGYIEMWGRGTLNIIDDCAKAGLFEPEFIEQRNEVVVRFRSHSYIPPHEVDIRLTERQREILFILSGVDEASLKEIMKSIESTVSERMVRNDLLMLKELHLIINTGFGRGSRWHLLKNSHVEKLEE